MKKLLLFTILTFVLAFSTVVVAEKKVDKPEDNAKVELKDVKEAKVCTIKGKKESKGIEACSIKEQKECKKLYGKIKKYEKLTGRLKEIRDIAAGENAPLTIKALDELIAKKQKHLDKKKAKLSKGKDCSGDYAKLCDTAKKISGTCPKTKDPKTCPVGCTKPCCAAKKNVETEAEKTGSDK